MTRSSRKKAAVQDRSPDWRVISLSLILVGATVAAYWPLLNCGFIDFDDPMYFSANERVLSGVSLAGLRWAMSATVASHWHPLTLLSHMTDATLFGRTPLGPHLVNLAFHIASVVLLFFILRSLTGAIWRSAAVAGLFALHPLHVESVAWIAERKDVLSLFLALLAVAAYVGYARRGGAWRMAAVTAALAAGLMSKPTLVTLPFVLLLLDFWPLRRVDTVGWPRLVWEKALLFVLCAASSVITYVVQRVDGIVAPGDFLPFPLRVTNALISYVQYMGKTIWPMRLAYYYPHPHTLRLEEATASALLLLALTVTAYAMRRTRPYLIVGWLWYVGALVPMIGLVQSAEQAMADRYTYLPLIGLFVAGVWTLAEATPAAARSGAAVAATVALAACGTVTFRQVMTWQNTLTLSTHALQVTERNHLAHAMLGVELLKRGRVDEAVLQLQEAIRLGANSAEVHSDLGQALMAKNDRTVALVHLERAVALNPRLAEAQYNLGHALSLLERPDAAIPHLRHALELRPAYPEAHFDLGMALGARDDVVGAVEHLAAAARLAPASAGAHKYLALALTSHGDVAAAVPHFREALRLSSDDVVVMHNLAAIESTHPDIGLRDGADAVRLEERARVLTSGQNAIVLMGLGAAYAEVGRFDEARAMVQQAIERASADGASDLVDRGRRTLVLFSAHRPFRQDFSPQPRHGADELPRDAR